jgi:hypothetical protein
MILRHTGRKDREVSLITLAMSRVLSLTKEFLLGQR